MVPSQRRKGYGKRVLRALEIFASMKFSSEFERLEAHIDPDNIASRALATNMGYQLTNRTENGRLDFEKITNTSIV